VARETVPNRRNMSRTCHFGSRPGDVNRLSRELDLIDEALLELSVRQSGQVAKMPRTTQLMDQLIELNKLNLLHKEDRQLLRQFLQAIRQRRQSCI